MQLSSNSSAAFSPDASFASETPYTANGEVKPVESDDATLSWNTLVLRPRFSFPVSLVLQGLFALSVVIVTASACALYASFAVDQRVNIAVELMYQLSACSIDRLDRTFISLTTSLDVVMTALVTQQSTRNVSSGALLGPAATVEQVLSTMAVVLFFGPTAVSSLTSRISASIAADVVNQQAASTSTNGSGVATNRSTINSTVFYWRPAIAVCERGTKSTSVYFISNATTLLGGLTIPPSWAARHAKALVWPIIVSLGGGAFNNGTASPHSLQLRMWLPFQDHESDDGLVSETVTDVAALGLPFDAACVTSNSSVDTSDVWRSPQWWNETFGESSRPAVAVEPDSSTVAASDASAGVEWQQVAWSPQLQATAGVNWTSMTPWLREVAPLGYTPLGYVVQTTVSAVLWPLPSNSTDGGGAANRSNRPTTPLLVVASLPKLAVTNVSWLRMVALFCNRAGANGARNGARQILFESGDAGIVTDSRAQPLGPLVGLLGGAFPVVDANGTLLMNVVSPDEARSESVTPLGFFSGFRATHVPQLSGRFAVVSSIATSLFDQGRAKEAVQQMILVSSGISLVIIGIGSFFFQMITRGLVQLADDFQRLAEFDVVEDELDAHSLSATSSSSLTSSSSSSATSFSGRMTRSIDRVRTRMRQLVGNRSADGSRPLMASALHESSFSELRGATHGIRTLLRHVLLLKRVLPSAAVLSLAGAPDPSNSPSASMLSTDDPEHLVRESGRASVTISVRYESRSTSEEFGHADFVFEFDERTALAAPSPDVPWNKRNLYLRLVSECLEHCHEDPFQRVTITFVSHENDHVVVRNSAQMLEILCSCAQEHASAVRVQSVAPSSSSSPNKQQQQPPTVRLLMHKSTTPKVTVQLTSFIDLFNFFSTVAFVAVTFEVSGGGGDPAIIAFCCLYAFAIGLNGMLWLVLVRQAVARDKAFELWCAARRIELVTSFVFSSLNLQNFELLCTGIRLERRQTTFLFFNAPVNDDVLLQSIQWSVFGFLFSDVSQLMFKIWRVMSAGSSSATLATILTLTTSSVSVLFNVAVKLHATFLWTRTNTDTLAGESTELQTREMSSRHPLTYQDCSLVFVRCASPEGVHQLSLLAVEWNRLYDLVTRCARQARAIVLHFHCGMILLLVSPRAGGHKEHELDAVRLAISIRTALAESTTVWKASLVVESGLFPVGVLGSLHKKATHVLCLRRGLELLGALGLLAEGASSALLLSQSTCEHGLGVDIHSTPCNVPVSTDEYIDGAPLQLLKPVIMFSTLRATRATNEETVADGADGGSGRNATALELAWPEFAFAYLKHEAPPTMSDTRTRFMTVAMGWSELRVDRLRIALGRIAEKGWDRHVVDDESELQVPPPPAPPSGSAADVQKVMQCTSLLDRGDAIPSETSASPRAAAVKEIRGAERTATLVVSPQKIFSL